MRARMQRPRPASASLTALSLVALMSVATPAGLAGSSGPCKPPRGAKIIAGDGASQAWRVTRDGGPGAPDIREYFACRRNHRPFRFEHGDNGASTLTDVPSAAIRGRYLAYGRIRKQGLGTIKATVIVRDLRTRRATFARRAVTTALELESFHHVVVRSSGSVAWIASNIVDVGGGEPLRVLEVYKHDAAGTQRLDLGTDIARRSLRLTIDGRVRWIRNGVARYAPLR